MAYGYTGIDLILIFIVTMSLFSWGIVYLFMRFNNKKNKLIREKVELHNAFQKELLKTQLETQEEAFHQIGVELHDNIGQLLSSTQMLLGTTERNIENVPDTLRTASQTLAQAIQELRMLSKSLNREWLKKFNVLQNLQAEVSRLNSAGLVQVQLKAPVQSLPISPESQVVIFRIIQEALQNSIKHAAAQQIFVEVKMDADLQVSISDDGRGFDADAGVLNGVGLMNMRHRIKLLGGTIDWDSALGRGTRVKLAIPLQMRAI